MASGESNGFISVDKFGSKNFNLYKFKLEMVLSTKDLWEIVEGTELPPPYTASEMSRRRMSGDAKKPSPSLPRAWWTRSWHISKDVKTGGSVEDLLQHPRDQKLVQHLVHKMQVLHHQDGQRCRHPRPYQ